MSALTGAQARVYDFVRDTIAARQAPPTRAEIARALGFASPNAAQAHLRRLADKGYLRLGDRRSRGISLVARLARQDSARGLDLAVIGRVAAGEPILAVAHVEQRVRVDPGLFAHAPDYLLRVRGDSMTGAGIHDADLIAVARVEHIAPGAIGVFRLDAEVTVKRYDYRDGRVFLRAENPAYDDICLDPQRDALALEGRAVGVVRSL